MPFFVGEMAGLGKAEVNGATLKEILCSDDTFPVNSNPIRYIKREKENDEEKNM